MVPQRKKPKPFSPFGNDLFGEPITQATTSPVAQKFLVPPFSVLNAREGDWQERKRAWIGMGIKSECGRSQSLNYSIPLKKYSKENMDEEYHGEKAQSLNTSIFDPVLCEIAYRWFSASGGQIIDPFAGGSVRGVVASCLGLRYFGGELRLEQVEANKTQVKAICNSPIPEYVCGDSRKTLESFPDADFIFSCPPYGNLEVYSDDENDLSVMVYEDFLEAYREIIFKSCAKLKDNRFACFVVGDFRDPKTGFYRNFVSETIRGFLDAGLLLYNEAILVTSVGSASMRVTKQFTSGRKFAKTHQNVLVFCKGDWQEAANYVNQPK